jgi:hypothetical protein
MVDYQGVTAVSKAGFKLLSKMDFRQQQRDSQPVVFILFFRGTPYSL